MAIELKEIINVDTATIKDVRDKIGELREEISRLKLENKNYTAEAEKVNVLQGHLNEVMTSSKKYTADAAGSFNALNAELRRLKDAWKAAGDEAKRAELGEQINEVKAKLNGMNESIGNFQHNVGNYSGGIIDAFQKMGISVGKTGTKMFSMFGMLTGGLGTLTKAFKGLWTAMAANPIGAVLAAVGLLIGAFQGLKKAIEGNEESQHRLHEAMAAFRPISDKFSNWMDKVALGFVQFAEVLADAFNWLRRVHAAYLDWIEGTDEHSKKVEGEIKYYNALAKAENALDGMRRSTDELNAADESRVALLRDEAALTKDNTEKTKKLAEARELQKKIGERNISLAQEELRVLEAQNKNTSNSVEINNKISAAKAKVERVTAEANLALVRFDRSITNYTASAGNAAKKTDEWAKEQEKLRKGMLQAAEQEQKEAEQIYKESVEALKTETQKEEEEYQRRRQLLIDHNMDTTALDDAYHIKKMERLADQFKEELEQMERQLDDEYSLEERRARIKSGEYTQGSTGVDKAMREAQEAQDEFERFKTYAEEKIAINETLMATLEEGSEEYTKLETENANLRIDLANKEANVKEKNNRAEMALIKAKQTAYKNMAAGTSSILKNLSSAMGESTKLGKGFAIAAATIDTIASAVTGFRAGMNQWADAGPMAWMGPVQAALNATMALTAGFAEVQKIQSVDTSGNASAGGGASATALAIPNIEGLSSPVDYTRQVTTETEQEEMNRNNRVYILESDIQESGKRVKVREEETTF